MPKMPRLTKFVPSVPALRALPMVKIYQIFTVPKPSLLRLSTSMQKMDTNWQMGPHPQVAAAFEPGVFEPNVLERNKESKLKLSLETRNRGDVIIVHCQGRIVYRDEAAVLARVVGEVLQQAKKLVLDLSGVSSIDSAGIGELALLQTWSQGRNGNLKCAGARPLVGELLSLTNLDSVLEMYPTVDAALESFEEEQINEEQVCADC
jgi:anti-sigma B factor antagonist